MSVISRFTCSTSRISFLSQQIRPGFTRQFQRKSRPSIDGKTTKFEPLESPSFEPHGTGRSTLPKYFIYTALVVPATFTGCIIWQYENFRSKAQRFRGHRNMTPKEFGFRDHLNSLWNQFSPGKKMMIGIVAANLVVFGLWRVPSLAPAMTRYFMCMPTKAHSVLGATLSGFSHMAPFHFFVNMYVLWSFSGALLQIMSHEQLLALYFSGITISSLASSVFKVASGRMIPSVGASGGVLTLLAYVCYTLPDSRLSIAFVDQIIPHSFSAGKAIYGVMLVDVMGLIFKWRLFDHAGHLGGVLFGLFYAAYGKSIIWEDWRRNILKWWHHQRTSGNES